MEDIKLCKYHLISDIFLVIKQDGCHVCRNQHSKALSSRIMLSAKKNKSFGFHNKPTFKYFVSI